MRSRPSPGLLPGLTGAQSSKVQGQVGRGILPGLSEQAFLLLIRVKSRDCPADHELWGTYPWGKGVYLIPEARGEVVVHQLLVEDGGQAARDGGHKPNPVRRAAPSHPLLVLQVLHERLTGGMMVHNGHLGKLRRRGRCQEVSEAPGPCSHSLALSKEGSSDEGSALPPHALRPPERPLIPEHSPLPPLLTRTPSPSLPGNCVIPPRSPPRLPCPSRGTWWSLCPAPCAQPPPERHHFLLAQ